MKFKLILSVLAVAFSLQVAAESNRHLVMLEGKAKSFNAKVAKLGGTVVFRHDKTKFAVVEGLSEEDVASLVALDMVAEIAPDFVLEMPNVIMEGTLAAPATVESSDNPAEASIYAYQWNMRAIDADKAWAAGRTGSADVTVAILDTGIAYTYPDLQGLVDLDRSVSFLPQDDALVAAVFPGMHPITDLHYHGTHVAATVASNGIVAAGVTSKTTLMGVKVCSVYGGCPGSAIFSGLAHAIDNGADVINMSLGGAFSKSEYPGAVGFYNKFFNYARSQGVTVVVSAGNSAIDLDHDGDGYKTYCSTPSTICVSATGPIGQYSTGEWAEVDTIASYSNYGRSAINVAAPGGYIVPVWAACSNTSLVYTICQTANYVLSLGGTSMAAPHVSGLAALMVEDFGRSPAKVKAAIEQSADDLGQQGTDPAYGKGRINVMNAIID
jgi:lantibiotic leader peptide-processing serine protease